MLGVVHSDAASVRQSLAPMADYVAGRLAEHGVDDVLIVVAGDRHSLTDLMRVGRVDWAPETAFNAIAIERSGYAQIVARTWRNGSPDYRSVFFVRKDSPIGSLRELSGARVAFERDASASGFFVPAVTLLGRDHVLCRLPQPQAQPAPDCVGYVFSQHPFNTAMWVHKRITQAGVLSSDDWASPAAVPAAVKEDLRVVHETDPFPRGVEIVRSGLDETLRQALVDLLYAMHEDPAAATALASYFGTRKFDPLNERDLATLEALRGAMDRFDDGLGVALR